MERPPPPPRDWFKFWLHFFCGVVVGLVIVGSAVLRGYRGSAWSWKQGAAVAVGSLLVGLLAGVKTDAFWEEGLPWLAGRGLGDVDWGGSALFWVPVVALILVAAVIAAHRHAWF